MTAVMSLPWFTLPRPLCHSPSYVLREHIVLGDCAAGQGGGDSDDRLTVTSREL